MITLDPKDNRLTRQERELLQLSLYYSGDLSTSNAENGNETDAHSGACRRHLDLASCLTCSGGGNDLPRRHRHRTTSGDEGLERQAHDSWGNPFTMKKKKASERSMTS